MGPQCWFVCKYCHRAFTEPRLLINHKKDVHQHELAKTVPKVIKPPTSKQTNVAGVDSSTNKNTITTASHTVNEAVSKPTEEPVESCVTSGTHVGPVTTAIQSAIPSNSTSNPSIENSEKVKKAYVKNVAKEVAQSRKKLSVVDSNRKKVTENPPELRIAARRPFRCSNCLMTFGTLTVFEKHVRVNHPELADKLKQVDLSNSTVLYNDGSSQSSSASNQAEAKDVSKGKKVEANEPQAPLNFVHSQEEFVCPDCPSIFTRRCVFEAHKKTHTKLSSQKPLPYKCAYCDKRWNSNYNRTVHERAHTGEKPAKCLYCNKCYSQSGQLSLHMKRVHPLAFGQMNVATSTRFKNFSLANRIKGTRRTRVSASKSRGKPTQGKKTLMVMPTLPTAPFTRNSSARHNRRSTTNFRMPKTSPSETQQSWVPQPASILQPCSNPGLDAQLPQLRSRHNPTKPTLPVSPKVSSSHVRGTLDLGDDSTPPKSVPSIPTMSNDVYQPKATARSPSKHFIRTSGVSPLQDCLRNSSASIPHPSQVEDQFAPQIVSVRSVQISPNELRSPVKTAVPSQRLLHSQQLGEDQVLSRPKLAIVTPRFGSTRREKEKFKPIESPGLSGNLEARLNSGGLLEYVCKICETAFSYRTDAYAHIQVHRSLT